VHSQLPGPGLYAWLVVSRGWSHVRGSCLRALLQNAHLCHLFFKIDCTLDTAAVAAPVRWARIPHLCLAAGCLMFYGIKCTLTLRAHVPPPPPLAWNSQRNTLSDAELG
jgi:hypothetical protein